MFGKYIMKKTQQKRRGGKTQKRRGGKTRKRRGEMKRKVMRGGNLTSTGKYKHEFKWDTYPPHVNIRRSIGNIEIYRDMKTIKFSDEGGESGGEQYFGYGYFDPDNIYVYFPISGKGNLDNGGKEYSISLIDCLKNFERRDYNQFIELVNTAYNQLKNKYKYTGDQDWWLLQHFKTAIDNESFE